jgi:hypothetical protein
MSETNNREWTRIDTGGGIVRWILGGFVLSDGKGGDAVEGSPCYVSHSANDHENEVRFDSCLAARLAVLDVKVQISDEYDPEIWTGTLTEWMDANEEDADCADAAMRMLAGDYDPIMFGGGAAAESSVRRVQS